MAIRKTLAFLLISITATAQIRFPELVMTPITGAPVLGQPILITGTKSPVVAQGHGLAAPAWYDWDGDGLKDLLIGEFGSGVETGRYVGNFIRVYKNIGTESVPEFTGAFDYARPPFELPGNGTPYSIDQFCCMGFTPVFVDLNKDEKPDIVCGNYYGEVTWFENTDKGFKPGELLPQAPPAEGGPRDGLIRKKAHQYYWLYSATSFGDLDSDSLPDLVVSSIMGLRWSKNVGTSTMPAFGEREILLDINNNPLKVYSYTEEELKQYEQLAVLGHKPPFSGNDHLSPTVVDWDNDGVLDLLVTNSYMHQGLSAVDFFKGRKTSEGHRFEKPVALFTAKTDKALPGSAPRISVCDWNEDGINDLLIGVSVPTVKGVVNEKLSWQWEKETGLRSAGKDPSLILTANLSEAELNTYKQNLNVPEGISMDDYMTILHQGYVYVMLGSKPDPKPIQYEKFKKRKSKK